MQRVLTFSSIAFLLLAGLTGCADSAPSNSVQDADAQAVADYEQMIADEAAAMNETEASENQ